MIRSLDLGLSVLSPSPTIARDHRSSDRSDDVTCDHIMMIARQAGSLYLLRST